jgi:hypothetical protein
VRKVNWNNVKFIFEIIVPLLLDPLLIVLSSDLPVTLKQMLHFLRSVENLFDLIGDVFISVFTEVHQVFVMTGVRV